MPLARSPAQIEAARRNGAKSRGPVTPEGKARASRNALRHGLSATTHLLLDGEDAAAIDALLRDLFAEHAPASALEAMLVRRLASALWRQERADRLEAKLFAWTEPRRVPRDGLLVPGDPEADFDTARLDAIRRHREAAAREVSRLLRELRSLRREPLAADAEAVGTDEPEPGLSPPPVPANDELPPRGGPARRAAPAPARPAFGPRPAADADAKRTRDDPFKSVPWPAPGRDDS